MEEGAREATEEEHQHFNERIPGERERGRRERI